MIDSKILHLMRYQNVMNQDVQELVLEDLRAAIDEIDEQLLMLLRLRADLVDRVGTFKTLRYQDASQKSFIRPGREASMVRDLIKKADRRYAPEAIIAIWRNIIGNSLHSEHPLTIGCIKNQEHQECYWLAREYLGSFIPIYAVEEEALLLQQLARKAFSVGFFPCPTERPGDWWAKILQLHSGHELKVFATVPFVDYKDSNISFPPRVFAIGPVTPEPTGDDISLMVLSHHIIPGFEQNLRKFCKDQTGFRILASREYATLVEVDGFFMDAEIPVLQKLKAHFIDAIYGISPLGAYAKPIVLPLGD